MSFKLLRQALDGNPAHLTESRGGDRPAKIRMRSRREVEVQDLSLSDSDVSVAVLTKHDPERRARQVKRRFRDDVLREWAPDRLRHRNLHGVSRRRRGRGEAVCPGDEPGRDQCDQCQRGEARPERRRLR